MKQLIIISMISMLAIPATTFSQETTPKVVPDNSEPWNHHDKDAQAIRKVLNDQNVAWNQGNIESFMHGYWENDSLKFIGKSGITYGYQQTLANYKKNYNDTAKMGKLSFDVLEIKRLSAQYYFVVGKWFLKRSIGDVGGTYTLLFRKIKGRWVIVVDHTS